MENSKSNSSMKLYTEYSFKNKTKIDFLLSKAIVSLDSRDLWVWKPFLCKVDLFTYSEEKFSKQFHGLLMLVSIRALFVIVCLSLKILRLGYVWPRLRYNHLLVELTEFVNNGLPLGHLKSEMTTLVMTSKSTQQKYFKMYQLRNVFSIVSPFFCILLFKIPLLT